MHGGRKSYEGPRFRTARGRQAAPPTKKKKRQRARGGGGAAPLRDEHSETSECMLGLYGCTLETAQDISQREHAAGGKVNQGSEPS